MFKALLLFAAVVPASAFGGITPDDDMTAPPAASPYPPGTVVETYEYDGATFRMVGTVPEGPGPYQLVAILPYTIPFDDSVAFILPLTQLIAATQGRAAFIVEYPDLLTYPDQVGALELINGDFPGALAKICPEWQRKALGALEGVNVLSQRPEIDAEGFALAGFSQGAGVATVLAQTAGAAVKAVLSTQFGPKLGADQLPDFSQPHPCGIGFYADGFAGQAPQSKRLSLISGLDTLFYNPTEDPALVGPVFFYQQAYSGLSCSEPQWDCTQADGSGFYVVEPGNIPDVPDQSAHSDFAVAFLDPGVLEDAILDPSAGEAWQAPRAFAWLIEAAFGDP